MAELRSYLQTEKNIHKLSEAIESAGWTSDARSCFFFFFIGGPLKHQGWHTKTKTHNRNSIMLLLQKDNLKAMAI